MTIGIYESSSIDRLSVVIPSRLAEPPIASRSFAVGYKDTKQSLPNVQKCKSVVVCDEELLGMVRRYPS